MSPEDRKKIDDFLKESGSQHTLNELEAIRKRAVRTLEEWCCQTVEQRKELSQDIKDMQMVVRYSLFATILGIAPILEALNGMDMAVEAAYNLGKANGKKCP